MLAKLSRGNRAAISVAAGDFFEDGANGLVTGYSLLNGGVLAVQQGVLPGANGGSEPFVSKASFVDVGMRPDFLVGADLNGDGHQDLVVAARGQNTLRVLLGDGHGNFTAQPAISLGGSLVSLAAWKSLQGQTLVVAGTCATACSLEFFAADGTHVGSVPVADQPSILQVARVNGSGAQDLIVGGASAVSVFDGRTVLSSSPKSDSLHVSGALTAAAGLFTYDRRNLPQIAVLTSDGSVRTFARTGLLPDTPAPGAHTVSKHEFRTQPSTYQAIDPSGLTWFEAETLPGIAVPSGTERPLLLRTRMSGSGNDDLIALNVNGQKMVTIGHPTVGVEAAVAGEHGTVQVLPARVETEPESTGEVKAALPLRVSTDARLGLVTVNAAAHPEIASLSTYHTFYVGSISDGAPVAGNCPNGASSNSCRLRDAIAAANADEAYNEAHGTADTINIPGNIGTYTLSYNTGLDSNGNTTYHIEIYGPINLIGINGTPTITTSNNDKIFSINSGYANNGTVAQTAFDIYMSSLTLTGARNTDNTESNGNQASSDDTGGIFDYETNGRGYMTLVNCNFTNSTDPYGPGGGIYVSDGYSFSGSTNAAGPGTLEIDGGTVSGNITSEAGGGISTQTAVESGNVPLLINGVTFTGNQVKPSINTADTYGNGFGGAIEFSQDTGSGVESLVINSIFTNNSTAIQGSNTTLSEGGAFYGETGLRLTNNQFLGNVSPSIGGAVYDKAFTYSPVFVGNTFAPYVSGSTTTKNTAEDGGAIYLYNDMGASPGPVASTIQYNRFFNNAATASGGRTGLAVDQMADTNTEATVTASYNWWGCNAGANGGTGCDSASGTSGKGTLTLSPFVVASASFSPSPGNGGQQVTLTGALNSYVSAAGGTATALPSGDLNAFTGVPVPANNDTSSGYTSTNPGGTVKATLTITEGGSQLAASTAATGTTATTTLSATPTTAGTLTGTVVIDNATVTVSDTVTINPATISQAFSPTTVAVGSSSTLTITLVNPNDSIALNGVAFTDTLSSGLVIASSPAASESCGGTYSATAGSSTISLTGGTINANSTCTLTVAVTPSSAGSKTSASGAVSSTNSSPSSNSLSSSATLTATAPDLTAASTHTGNFKAGDTADTYTLTVSNTGTSSSNGTTVSLVDTLPSGFTATALAGSGWTCTLSSPTCTRSDALAAGSSYPVVLLTVSVSSADAGTYSNSVTVSGGGDASTGDNTGTDSTNVIAPPTIAQTFSPTTVAPNVNSTITFTVGNPSANPVTLTGLAFSETLPTGLKLSGTATTTCSGATVTGASGGSSIGISGTGSSLAAGATCTVTDTVASAAVGSYTGVTNNVTATNSNAGGTATATLTVAVTPTRVVFTTVPPTSITAGGNAGTITAALEDAAGNVNTASSGTTVTFTVTGSGGYSQTYTAATTNGVATVNLSSVALTVAGSYSYTASATGLTSTPSAAETVNPGAFASLAVSGFPAATTAQVAGTVTVRATDSYGNTVTSFTGSVTLSSTDSSATVPAAYTYTASDAGSHGFSVIFNTAGTFSITATSGSTTGSETGIVVGDALWVLSNTGLRTEITESGTTIYPSSGTAETASTYGALAIDSAGTVWQVNSGSNSVYTTSYKGTPTSSTTSGAAGVATPVGIAIDGLGNAWIVNSGANTVSEFSNTLTPLSATSGFATNGTGCTGVAIDISGNVWISNGTSNTVTRILGAAAPVVSPISVGVGSNTQGTQP